MLNIHIDFDELVKVIDQLSAEQKRVLQERLSSEMPQQSLKKRVAGLGEGTIWISDDFDEPLSDEFWLGEDA